MLVDVFLVGDVCVGCLHVALHLSIFVSSQNRRGGGGREDRRARSARTTQI